MSWPTRLTGPPPPGDRTHEPRQRLPSPPLRPGSVRRLRRPAAGRRGRCAKRDTRSWTPTRHTRCTASRRRWAWGVPRSRPSCCGRPRRRGHRLLDDLLHERRRLPHQRGESTAAQPPVDDSHHLRTGGVAGRDLGVLRAVRPDASLPEPYHPVFEAASFRLASIDSFFLSVEVPDGINPADVAVDMRGFGSTEVQIIEESER